MERTDVEPSLARTLTLGQVFALAFGAILGAGWIVGVGQWLQLAGSFGAVIALAGGSLIMCLVALCYAEAAALYPSSGGEIEYVVRFFGRRAGHCAGWMLGLTYVCACSFEAISIAWLCEAIWPPLRTGAAYSFLGAVVRWPQLSIATAATLLAWGINFRGGASLGRVQSVLTCILVASALVFVSAAILDGHLAYLMPHFVADAHGALSPGIAAVFASAPFWFSGFGVVSYSMGEIQARTRVGAVAWVVVLAVLAALAFYAAMIIATALTMPRAQLLRLELPASTAFSLALGSVWLARLVLLAGIVALQMALNAILYAASRVFFQLSQMGLLPGGLGAIHAVRGSPYRAVTLATLIVALVALAGRGATASLVDLSAVSISIVYILVCAGVTRLRFTAPGLERPYRTPCGVIIPVLATLATTGMILGSILPLLDDPAALVFQCSVLLSWTGAGLALAYIGKVYPRISSKA